jgi:hypothetical protein
MSEARCAWIGDGLQCRNPGAFSNSTVGGGPWYCREHWGRNDPIAGADIVQESVQRHASGVPDFVAIVTASRKHYLAGALPDGPQMSRDQARESFRHIGHSPADPKAWAHRILERVEAGERVPQLSVAFAREALGLPIERQPGEEG